MSLVDDARRLAEIPPEWDAEAATWVCSGCATQLGPFTDPEHDADVASERFVHEEHCPWLSMPRIVAALEAAERVVRIHEKTSGSALYFPVFHEIDVLGDTLRGEEYTLEAPPA